MGLVANKKQMLVMIICVFLVLSVNKIAAQDLCYGRCYKFCREGYNYNILRCGIRCIDACLAYSVELKKGMLHQEQEVCKISIGIYREREREI